MNVSVLREIQHLREQKDGSEARRKGEWMKQVIFYQDLFFEMLTITLPGLHLWNRRYCSELQSSKVTSFATNSRTLGKICNVPKFSPSAKRKWERFLPYRIAVSIK